MAEWLVLDFDGVLRHWDADHFAETARTVGLTATQLAEVALSGDMFEAAMIGKLTAEEWQAEIGRIAAERYGCSAADTAMAFSQLQWAIDHAVVDVVRDVRNAGVARVALFSNASTNLEADLVRCALDELFDHVANSSRLNMMKPDPAAFAHVARLLGVEPGACLFVDDIEANVAGAREAGMRAERFLSAVDLRTLLVDEGLLP